MLGGATSGGFWEWFLDLCSGMTLGRLRGNIWVLGIEPLGQPHGGQEPYSLHYLPGRWFPFFET